MPLRNIGGLVRYMKVRLEAIMMQIMMKVWRSASFLTLEWFLVMEVMKFLLNWNWGES